MKTFITLWTIFYFLVVISYPIHKVFLYPKLPIHAHAPVGLGDIIDLALIGMVFVTSSITFFMGVLLTFLKKIKRPTAGIALSAFSLLVIGAYVFKLYF